MRRRALLGSVVVVQLAGCVEWTSGGEPTCGPDCDIGMTADRFRPETFETTVGTTVTWRNTSSKGHTVTAYETGIPEGAQYFASGGYASQSEAIDAWFDRFGGRIDRGQTYRHTFEVPGRYDYYCIPHDAAGMVGTVIVEDV